MNVPPAVIQTPGFAHYNLAWSPFHTERLAIASSANYGLVGNGRLHLASLAGPSGVANLKLDKFYETQDALYDVAWSEIHENQLVTASGDGSIRLWDVMLNDLPIRAWHEHTREIFCVDWSNIRKDQFATSSWDGQVKLWSPEHPRSILTLQTHHSCVYQALFSPHQGDILATGSTDGTVKIFDLRAPSFAPSSNSFTAPLTAAALTVPASGGEILSIDWNKYRPFVLASAGVDKTIRVWDCRMVKLGNLSGPDTGPAVGGTCETQLMGHEYAVRKIQWSPHRPDMIASASYDMTCRIWTTNPPPGRTHLVRIHDPHTEFVVGCAWSLYEEDPEDILSNSLEYLYDYTPITQSSAGSVYTYTTPSSSAQAITITLSTPDTQAENWKLHASSIWVSSTYIADHIEELQLDAAPSQPLQVLELGAGAGLPGILAAKRYPHLRITSSDYPDAELIRALEANVKSNGVSDRCRVVPYAWGSDTTALLAGTDRNIDGHAVSGFDVVVAADTLWNPELHAPFIDTLCRTLAKTAGARIRLVAGLHTGRYTLQAFFGAVKNAGLDIEKAVERAVKGGEQRDWDVNRAEDEDEQERRRWVVWVVLKWKDAA
ncbi:WD40 repeat-like protein [Dentipellis sp. KUC8613]|nr:WD40 repeat-like protein [Dentipellis sp. KUC8613]